MHLFSILHVFGTLLMVTGISMVLPMGCALIYAEGDFAALSISALLTLLIGVPLWWFFRKNHDLGIKDGIFIAGGIAKRYPDLLKNSGFRSGFENKGRYRSLMERVPTQLILHDQPGLLGAAYCALQMSQA